MNEKFGYEKLEVWQLGMQVAETAFRLASSLPPENRFDVASQMRRSALSIPSNIAEGYGRESTASFANFIRIAQGSLYELRTITALALRMELLKATDSDELQSNLVMLSKMLSNFLKSLDTRLVKEEQDLTYNLPPTANR